MLVCRKEKQEQVLDDDRNAECNQKRRLIAPADYTVEHRSLDAKTDKEHDRNHDDQGNDRIVDNTHTNQADIACKYEKVSVGKIGDLYDAEDHAHAESDCGIKSANQYPLYNRLYECVQFFALTYIPKYAFPT